jgi:SAM-dependent methyltransferase
MTHCPICEAEKLKLLLKWKAYAIHKCATCKLIFTTPLPSDKELQDFYQGFMFNKPESWEMKKAIVKKKKELIALFKLDLNTDYSNKKILDYGGGTGIAYKAMCELGLDTYYQDLDENAISFTQTNFSLPKEKTIRSLNETDIKFDYIFSDNVIEHVKEPIAFTKALSSNLAEGGVLMIKTPHASNTEILFNPIISIKGYFLGALKYNSLFKSLQACINRFWHSDPPRHLYSFSALSLIKLAQQMNLEDMQSDVSYYKIPIFENTVTKLFFSKDKRLSGIKSVLIRVLLFPILPIEILLQLSKELLLFLKILTPGGIILRLSKEHSSNN